MVFPITDTRFQKVAIVHRKRSYKIGNNLQSKCVFMSRYLSKILLYLPFCLYYGDYGGFFLIMYRSRYRYQKKLDFESCVLAVWKEE